MGHAVVEDSTHSPEFKFPSAAGKPDPACKGHRALSRQEAPLLLPLLGVGSVQ